MCVGRGNNISGPRIQQQLESQVLVSGCGRHGRRSVPVSRSYCRRSWTSCSWIRGHIEISLESNPHRHCWPYHFRILLPQLRQAPGVQPAAGVSPPGLCQRTVSTPASLNRWWLAWQHKRGPAHAASWRFVHGWFLIPFQRYSDTGCFAFRGIVTLVLVAQSPV